MILANPPPVKVKHAAPKAKIEHDFVDSLLSEGKVLDLVPEEVAAIIAEGDMQGFKELSMQLVSDNGMHDDDDKKGQEDASASGIPVLTDEADAPAAGYDEEMGNIDPVDLEPAAADGNACVPPAGAGLAKTGHEDPNMLEH